MRPPASISATQMRLRKRSRFHAHRSSWWSWPSWPSSPPSPSRRIGNMLSEAMRSAAMAQMMDLATREQQFLLTNRAYGGHRCAGGELLKALSGFEVSPFYSVDCGGARRRTAFSSFGHHIHADCRSGKRRRVDPRQLREKRAWRRSGRNERASRQTLPAGVGPRRGGS